MIYDIVHRQARPEGSLSLVVLAPVAVSNGLEHGMITVERRDGLRIDEEGTLAGTLERCAELKLLVIDKEACTIDQPRGLGESDKHGIVDIDLVVAVDVAVLDVTGHHVAVLTGRVVDVVLVAEEPFGNVAHGLADLVALLTLPGRLVGGFLDIFIFHTVVGQRAIEDKPEVISEHVLDLGREVHTA